MTLEQHRDQISRLLERCVDATDDMIGEGAFGAPVTAIQTDAISTLTTTLTELDSHIRAEQRADEVHVAVMSGGHAPFTV